MKQIVNKCLLAGDKFIPEMNLSHLDLLIVLADHLLKIYKEFKHLCKQEIQNYIYKNELDKACFQHDMAYGKYKDLEKRAQSDKVLKGKAFEIANNPKYDGYQGGLASRVYKFFDKKSKGAGQQLANELYKPIIRKF